MKNIQYWDIDEVLPFQRNFNLINGPRSIGKTYTTLKRLIKYCIRDGSELVYIVRTQDEKKNYALKDGFNKVCTNEYPNEDFHFDIEHGEVNGKTFAWCIALTQAEKIKKRSFPNVKYIVFDEYMLESNDYIKGFKEPDLFLSIYHTIDREEDRVICFLLGNNSYMINPYHIHPAFNIPSNIEPGKIWTSENVLFQNAKPPQFVKMKKSRSKFAKMIEGSDYGDYANEGKYKDSEEDFLVKFTKDDKQYIFTIYYNGDHYGVYSDIYTGTVYITDKPIPNYRLVVCFQLVDHKDGTTFVAKSSSITQSLTRAFRMGRLKFNNVAVREKVLPLLRRII